MANLFDNKNEDGNWIDGLYSDPNPFSDGDVREKYPEDETTAPTWESLIPDGWDGGEWDEHVATSLFQGEDPMNQKRW